MKEKTSLVFTGDIGFDRYMYGKWDDENLISKDVLDFLHSADHVIANVEGPVAEVEQNTTKDGVQQLLHTIDPKALKVLKNITVSTIKFRSFMYFKSNSNHSSKLQSFRFVLTCQ